MFELCHTGECKSKTKTENIDIRTKMSWAGTICTVQRDTLDCDWTEGVVKEIKLEDMIGSGLGDEQLFANTSYLHPLKPV